jgi:hypothetical protein
VNFNWDHVFRLHLSMPFLLTCLSIFLLILLYIWHKDKRSKVDLTDLICSEGKVDEKKFTRLGAWIVSTWGFVYLILDNKFTEWYFTGYIAVWVGNAIVDKYLNSKNTQEIKTEGTHSKL